jgi:hypothetical protein
MIRRFVKGPLLTRVQQHGAKPMPGAEGQYHIHGVLLTFVLPPKQRAYFDECASYDIPRGEMTYPSGGHRRSAEPVTQ